MNKQSVNKELIDKMLAVISVYGPLKKKEIIEYLDNCFSYVLTVEDKEYLDLYLDSLVDVGRLFKVASKYSSLNKEILNEVNKEFKDIILSLKDKKKDYRKEELIKYADVNRMDGIKEFDELKNYFYSLNFKNNSIKDELFLALCFGLYSCFDVSGVIDELKEVTTNLDIKKLDDYLAAYDAILPRPFFNGFTYEDISNMEDELKEKFEENIKDKMDAFDFDAIFDDKYKVKEKINKKQYGDFTYQDCIDLANIVNKSKIFKQVDSDKVLEFLINDKPVYLEILGYYGKDKGILLFRSREEMITTHAIMQDDEIDNYPDFPKHIACIEISEKGTEFLDDKMIEQLRKNNLPVEPNFVSINGYKGRSLPNQEELNLIGGALSDIIKLLELSSLSDIKAHLGDNGIMFDIYQVYVGDDKVLYGKYNDIETGDIILDFKLDNIDKELIKKIKKYTKHDISIGAYIFDGYFDDIKECPHTFLIRDNNTGLIIEYMLKTSKEIKTIKNDILKSLIKKHICPNNIYVNNDYCYEIFAEFIEYFDLEYDEENSMNDIYRDFLKKVDLFAEEKVYKA